MAISGTEGYVTVGGSELTADKWDYSGKSAIVDRSSFKTDSQPLNAKGQKTGVLNFEGPYEEAISVTEGEVYAFVLGLTDTVNLAMNARVENFDISDEHSGGPRFKITAHRTGGAATFTQS